MARPLRLVLVLHNHQPIGNFDSVVEQAYCDSYLPFLQIFARYPALRISLHTSGSLFDWLSRRHPEYLDLVGDLARAGRIEILGGAYHEPILPMIPGRDRRGQIRSYSQRLQERFGVAPLGMWLPERVWEQSLASDLAQCGIEHTLLDDFHFAGAGLAPEELFGYYLTEDDGHLAAVFPGSERLRYLIPFAPPHETIAYLRSIATTHPGGVVVFGDDGEKFGTWPGMKQHVYEQGWLTQFFDALAANTSWLHVTTMAEAVNNVRPLGKIFLPDASYREMTRWASLADRYAALPTAGKQPPASNERGCWRNFRVKYPEADEMYARMLLVSNRLEAGRRAKHDPAPLDEARDELYRAQCNCSYWHGTFGGIYLPHLRHAVYRHLIAADNLLDRAAGRAASWVMASHADFNLDVHKEVALANEHLIALVAPERGGQLYELDVRSVCHNLLATLARRPEPYHAELIAAETSTATGGQPLAWKQPGLDQLLHYDSHPRKSLLDHFFDHGIHLDEVSAGRARELGDFAAGAYETELHRRADRVQLVLSRQGMAAGHSIRITKTLTLASGGKCLEVEYRLEGLPDRHTLHFGVEFNFAIPGGGDDRYFHDGKRKRLAQAGETLDLANRRTLYLVDEHLGIDAGLRLSRTSHVWTFPVQTVSRSETGLELVHQSVVMMPHWSVQADSQGCWSVTIQMPIDTSLAEARQQQPPASETIDLGNPTVVTPHRGRRGRMSIAA